MEIGNTDDIIIDDTNRNRQSQNPKLKLDDDNNHLTNNTNHNSNNTSNNLNTSNNSVEIFDHPPSKRININKESDLPSPGFNPNNNNNNNNSSNINNSMEMNVDQNDANMIESSDLTATQNAANNINDDSMNTSNSNNNNNPDETEDDSRAEATFQLVVTEFSKFRESKENRLSPSPCIVRNLPWKILAMSKQLNNKDFVLGFFLQCNAESDSNRWSVYASAELRLLHTTDPEKNLVKKIQHLFYLKENDWGFSPFTSMKDVMDPEKGFYNAEKDLITLEVWVNADAPHGTAWDSKKLTGYVGLTNQGATCYMNSLLQTLFFTNELRKAVYQVPTENDDPIKSVPYALQRVFHDLQFSEKSVGTKKLTRSFGWETLDTFMQHDVQELCRVLLDNLENKMKHTKVEGVIPNLFSGKMISYVKCKTIDYESRRVEGFYDIQLNIKGKKDIYESFKDYVTVESLEGENKYDAGKYGLQEAQKGVIFETFPPILHLHLMRFQYDPQTDSNIKINDKYEFFDEIELDDYLEKKEATPAKYLLHAVLVHSGDNHGGHYVVFINPKLDNKWFKFDDEVVSRCSRKDAITANFGGSQSDEFTFRHSTNAYMLVYVRDSHKQVVLSELKKADIPEPLQERLAEEKRIEMIRKKERNEAHLYMQINIFLEKEFYDNSGFADLYDPSKVEATKQLKVKKMSTMLELYKQISETVNQPMEDLRIWSLMNRYNNTIRPLNCYELKELAGRNVLDVCKQESAWNIFVESAGDFSFSLTFDYMSLLSKSPSQVNQQQQQLSPNSQSQQQQKLPQFKPDEEVMIFFKFYEPKTSTLRYVFRMYLSKMVTLVAIQERINKKMKFPLNTELLFYEEVKISQITPLTNRDLPLHKLAHEQLLNGDIYVFQINEKEKLQNYKLPTVTDYFKDLNLQVEVLFCDKNQPNDEGFTLLLSSKMKYDEFARRVGQHLNYDHEKLQFFRATNSSTSSVSPSSLNNSSSATAYDLKANQMLNQAIKYNPEFQLKDALGPLTNKQQFQQHPQQQQTNKKLFYSKLNIKIHELEERRPFKCTWVSSNLKVERELILMPFKKANVKELLGECRSELLKENLINKEQCEDEQNFRLRLVEIVGSRLHRIFREDALIESLDNAQISGNKYYRIEQILPEEFSLINNLNSTNGQDYLLPIAHFSKEIYATFGSPFLLKVKLGEPFKDIKQRIQRKLDINDKEFATYRFAVISMGSPSYLPDNDDNVKFELSNLGGIQPWLGIDHKNTASKTKSKFSTMEKAIKIFN